MTKHLLEKTELDDKWDDLVTKSVNGTVFCTSQYLKNIDTYAAPYYYRRNQELRAAVLLIETQDRLDTCLHDFVIYNGVIFAPPQNKQNRSQIISEQFDISSFVAEELARIYKSVHMQLHPTIIDIRPFLWFNYGADGPKYTVDLRYTSYLNIEDFSGAEKLEDISTYLQASNARRQEIRYGIRDKVVTKEEFNPDLFVDFYNETMMRQDIAVEENVLRQMNSLITNLFKAKIGRMFVSYLSSGEPGSMAFFVMDTKRGYYLFGANDPALRDSHTGTAVLWDAFHILSKDGIKEIDMEGTNSPYRGWFKLSFGGDLRPYYQIYKGDKI
jgi:Acetyltransferase (GNAT) domain